MKLGTSGSRFESNEKVLSASFKISQLITKSKKPLTIGENLLKPCLLTAVEKILGAETKKKIQEIPLSNNTVKARIDEMSFDIEEQLLVRIKNSPFFALQCDKTTDVSQCCQLCNAPKIVLSIEKTYPFSENFLYLRSFVLEFYYPKQ